MSELSILVPTHNRSAYLRRLLEYLVRTRCQFEVIVSDSSDQHHRALNRQSIAGAASTIQIQHQEFEDLAFLDKLRRTLASIQSRYIFVCGDDDFVVSESLARCVEFLSSDETYSHAHGRIIQFSIAPSRDISLRGYRQCGNDESELGTRLLAHFSEYTTNFYSVQRTADLVAHMDLVASLDIGRGLVERLLSALLLIKGRRRMFPDLFMVREKGHSLTDEQGNRTIEDVVPNGGSYADEISRGFDTYFSIIDAAVESAPRREAVLAAVERDYHAWKAKRRRKFRTPEGVFTRIARRLVSGPVDEAAGGGQSPYVVAPEDAQALIPITEVIREHVPLSVLMILDFLPLPGSGNRKEGVYPTFVRVHGTPFLRTTVCLVKEENEARQRAYCNSHGIAFLNQSRASLQSVVRYVLAIFRHAHFRTMLSWVWFTIRHRALLAGIDGKISDTKPPNLIAALTSMELSGRLAYLVSIRHGVPYVARENRTYYTRGVVRGNFKALMTEVASTASAILPVSPHLGQLISETLNVPSERMKPMQNAVANDQFIRPETHEWIEQFAKGRFVFAGWTNWRDIKRVDVAIRAFAEVRRSAPETCLIIAGPVPDSTDELVHELGVDDSVLLVGSLDRDGIRYLAHYCDCCIVTSDHDPGNNSVLEAMAAGKPVVVTRCGGTESRVAHPGIGRVVDRGRPHEFAQAMLEVLENIDSFKPDAIIEECRREYSEEALQNRFRSIYSEVVGNRQNRAS